MNSDFNPPTSATPDQTQSAFALSDPVETILETTARLRVLERLLQRTLAPETTAGERRGLLVRFNRQRQELFTRIEGAPAGHMQPTPGQLQELIAGPLPQDCTDTVLCNAVVNVHRMIDLLEIC